MSRHSKRSIRILNSEGSPYTNRRAASRMVDRFEASWVDERTILLSAPRDRAPQAAARPHSPLFRVVRKNIPLSEPQGFNRYPVDPEETKARWKRQKQKKAAA